MGGNVTIKNQAASRIPATPESLSIILNLLSHIEQLVGHPIFGKITGSVGLCLREPEAFDYVESFGDVDVITKAEYGKELFNSLPKVSGFIGCNRDDIKSLGTQINCLFEIPGIEGNVQIDFELTENPGWSEFAHSASLEDLRRGIKGLHHKLLLRALLGAVGIEYGVCLSCAGKPLKAENSNPLGEVRVWKFSVDYGLRRSLYQDGTVYDGGLPVYRQIPVSESSYLTDIGSLEDFAGIQDISSFVGIAEGLKDKDPPIVHLTAKRYFESLWGWSAQRLFRNDPERDLHVKLVAWSYLTSKVPQCVEVFEKKTLDLFYSVYGGLEE